MTDRRFFEISREQSRVKAVIVTKYFLAWASVMMGAQDRHAGNYGDRIAYLDLFAGPGRYEDGTKSAPLMILEKAIADEKLRSRLVTIFNDADKQCTRELQSTIADLPGIETLRYPPQVLHEEVGAEIIKMFVQTKMVPTFFFVDPWGYKGLSLRLIDVVLKDWGCDCIFFFNYNRISMGLSNELVEEHMNALFGEERAERLREKLHGLTSEERELVIVEELCAALKDTAANKRYVLPFRFRTDSGKRTSHHLIFVSKGFKGYEIMKDVMARESSSSDQGVASFEYSPASNRQPLLFELSQPLDGLGEMLLKHFGGRTLSFREIYERHNVDRPFIERNYKDVLLKLESTGAISTSKHRKGTFGPKVIVKFPELVRTQ
ncbi:MAG: three-Cys-motif partner protein TcmP [Burkholderiales bacterium]|nr:three-Cys-motif partner protein TcmP [Burkholderiales bacterium]